MKRDMELIRKLLLYVEDYVTLEGIPANEVSIGGFPDAEVVYNLLLLYKGEYLLVYESRSMTEHQYLRFRIKGVSWEGHELLDAIRDDRVWTKTMEKLAPVGSVGIEVLKAVAVSVAKGMLGLG
ncbi:MAG: DUF2513 domain-containing protein [Armatimonadota bacterium]